MKTYQLNLKGTKKNGTKDLKIKIHGDNKQQAWAWAYKFFQCGEYKAPYTNIKGDVVSTDTFIPGASGMLNLGGYAGKYFVPTTAVKVIK